MQDSKIALSQDVNSDVDAPDHPGPNALGHTPLVGTLRRENGMPVLRDEATEAVDGLDAVDVPDEPVLPILNTNR